jgi:hypothetical protein
MLTLNLQDQNADRILLDAMFRVNREWRLQQMGEVTTLRDKVAVAKTDLDNTNGHDTL